MIWKAKVQGDLMADSEIEVRDRYATYEQALRGHEVLVAEVLKQVGGWLTYDKQANNA